MRRHHPERSLERTPSTNARDSRTVASISEVFPRLSETAYADARWPRSMGRKPALWTRDKAHIGVPLLELSEGLPRQTLHVTVLAHRRLMLQATKRIDLGKDVVNQ